MRSMSSRLLTLDRLDDLRYLPGSPPRRPARPRCVPPSPRGWAGNGAGGGNGAADRRCVVAGRKRRARWGERRGTVGTAGGPARVRVKSLIDFRHHACNGPGRAAKLRSFSVKSGANPPGSVVNVRAMPVRHLLTRLSQERKGFTRAKRSHDRNPTTIVDQSGKPANTP